MARSISAYRRRLVYERDDYTCQGCGAKFVALSDGRPSLIEFSIVRSRKSRIYGLEIDHVRPVRHGGADLVANLQALCTLCNARKGARV